MDDFKEITKDELQTGNIILCVKDRKDYLLKIMCRDGEIVWFNRLSLNIPETYRNINDIFNDGQKLYLIKE